MDAGIGSNSKKKGEACSRNILGLVAVGDNSINSAKKNGTITKIATVDYSKFLFF